MRVKRIEPGPRVQVGKVEEQNRYRRASLAELERL
jgi:hypothetical protein